MSIRMKVTRQPARIGRIGAAGRLLDRLKRDLDRRAIREGHPTNDARRAGSPRTTDKVKP